jgi:uncharacterized membrane protein
MRHHRISGFSLRRPALAGLAALLATGMSGTSGAAGADDAAITANATASACSAASANPTRRICRYSIINLDPEGGAAAFLNERGEAAVGSFVFGTNRFFDGDRLHDIGSLGGGFTSIAGLNNKGVVVGESSDASEPFPRIYGFRWTVAGGMRAIPGSDAGRVLGVNDRNQVVGSLFAPGVTARAVRWDADNRVVNLGPLPFSLSEAEVINDRALAGGYTDFADGTIHASLWDSTGKTIDLGTLGGSRAFTQHINKRNEAAGYSDNAANDNELGFYWSARDGVVPTGAQGFPTRLVAALNDKGEITGDTDVPGGSAAYLWSRLRGLTLLPRAGAAFSDAFDLNNKTQVVGGLGGSGPVDEARAVRWDGLANPVDLNTLLYRPPAGLVLNAGVAINDAGTILAVSNAGLVMLRPGTRGTDAPVLGPVAGLPFAVDVGQDVHLTLGFVDNSATQTHKAVVDWNDGCPSPAPVVTESRGTGQVAFQHRFCTAGYYVLTIRVTDSGGRTTETRKDVVVNSPGLATVGGSGNLVRTAASGGFKAPVHFAFWAPAGNAAPLRGTGNNAFVRLDGPFQFRSDRIGTMTRGGQAAHLEGTGSLNGRSGYRFVIDATDAGQQQAGSGDSLRVRITHTDAGGKEVVDYDNGAAPMAAASAATHVNRTLIENGDIVLKN